MQSARLLMDHWDHPADYTRAVLKAFQWMEKERAVLDKLAANQSLSISDALVLNRLR